MHFLAKKNNIARAELRGGGGGGGVLPPPPPPPTPTPPKSATVKVIICAAVFAATSTHPGFLYLQSLRLLVLCVLLAMWFSSGLLLHTLSRIMMVVGWRIATKHLPSSSMLTNIITEIISNQFSLICNVSRWFLFLMRSV